MQREYDLVCEKTSGRRSSTGMKVAAGFKKFSSFFKQGHSLNRFIKMTQTASTLKLCVMGPLGAVMNEYERDGIIRTNFIST